MKLSYEDMKLLDKILLLGIKNGNTVNPEPYTPTPKEYKRLYSIRHELEYDIMCIESFK